MTLNGVFVSARETRQYAAGDVIFTEGDPSSEMYGVVSGSVDLRRDGQSVAVAASGGTFGEMGIIDHAPRSLTAVATEPSEIAVIDERTFLFLVQETPMFALRVMQAMAARIRERDESG